jgi:hypothetical protein
MDRMLTVFVAKVEAWCRRLGKSARAFYRRLAEIWIR